MRYRVGDFVLDLLIATVWEGRAVSEHLLGDGGDVQRMIRTIHGKGFRY
jgi:DNA-binding winged helix-turn-helix (wHTH) protein